MSGFIDPYRMAKNGQELQGTVPVAAMPRVNKLLASDRGDLAYHLSFDVDEQSTSFIAGELHGVLTMRCQRCMQPFDKELKCSFKVSPVTNDDEAKGLGQEYEPVIVQEEKLELIDLIEDELILALPIVVMHEIDQDGCKEILADNAQEQSNPFDILRELKLNKKGQQAGDKNGSTTES